MANQLAKIEHVVLLMLENRSFDQMLGFLYTDSVPKNQSPSGDPFDGLTGEEFNLDSAGNKHSVFRITKESPHPYLMPGCDPREGFEATNLQLFGSTSIRPGTKANNGGFVVSFENAISYDQGRKEPDALPDTKPGDIMGIYDPSTLPVMTALARKYAVCDSWFASVPTETFPNRAFACTGTSLGHLKDDFKILNTPSIFGRMSDAGLSWAAFGYNGYPYVRTDYPDTKAADRSHFGHYSDFFNQAKNDTLPAFTFLEPSWGASGNSQHPNYDVSLGEKLIYDIYQGLRASPAWPSTLLIITYDEHGGGYDHVPPPDNATPPDQFTGDVDHLDFDFKRFGVRVPALLISPLIKEGSVFRSKKGTIDHTSVIRTLRERWPTIRSLTKRDAAAPSLGDVLTLTKARDDNALAGITAPSPATYVPKANRPSKLQKLQAAKVANLPIPNEHGTYDHEMPDLTTSNQAAEYIRDRTAAWQDHVERRRAELKPHAATGHSRPRRRKAK